MRIIPAITAVLVTVFLFLLVLQRDALFSFANGGEATPEPVVAQESTTEPLGQPIAVVAMRSVAREIDSAVILRGETNAARQVEMRAQTSGQVISEPLRKGSYVKEGQALCVLDPGTRAATLAEAQARLEEAKARGPEAEARVAEALARLDEAKLNDTAAAKLSKDGYASDTRVAATRANVSSADSAVAGAKAGLQSVQSGIQAAQTAVAAVERDIANLTITAPFEGLLESDTAELGSLLQPGALCSVVIQLDPIKIVGFVPETQVARVQVGALAGARLAGGDEVRGRVTFLSRSADVATRTFRVEIDVANPDLALRDGQTAEILISAPGSRAHLLPQSALTLNDSGVLGVRVVTANNIAAFRPVTLIRDSAEGVWVSGLEDEENVIIIGQEYVVDGVAIAPTFEERSQ